MRQKVYDLCHSVVSGQSKPDQIVGPLTDAIVSIVLWLLSLTTNSRRQVSDLDVINILSDVLLLFGKCWLWPTVDSETKNLRIASMVSYQDQCMLWCFCHRFYCWRMHLDFRYWIKPLNRCNSDSNVDTSDLIRTDALDSAAIAPRLALTINMIKKWRRIQSCVHFCWGNL